MIRGWAADGPDMLRDRLAAELLAADAYVKALERDGQFERSPR